MSKLHVIEKQNRLVQIEPMTYESGYWHMAVKTAEKLVGGMMFFHRGQDKPAFFGGMIVGFRVEEQGEFAGRIVFKFVANPINCRGARTEKRGWSQEMKIVLDW